ncbi:uncharacterized protein MELLADRAFT_109312 [Melampsora larici-populina 98AG31]|uniref:Secreted protein n=1 Tax=Melampsora larici-populina (strain 98AG31 / pathotype 3-4-7) TaxID=747676 RepID=F4RW24_MELLP|nr:uncharacterized protein MELLADRAFT_109312 [Melampsora larici-populina 98AG31]EGG03485.1 secreted protein [Melampsora larici-populina 98AG31]
MRSFTILIFAMVVLFQSLLAAPSTLSVRSEQTVGQMSAESNTIRQKLLGLGLSLNILGNYASNYGYPLYTCGNGYILGCGLSNYQTTCWSVSNCNNGYGYANSVGYLNGYFNNLITLRKAELKSEVNHKENENQA